MGRDQRKEGRRHWLVVITVPRSELTWTAGNRKARVEFLFSQQRRSKDTSIVFFFSARKDKEGGREQSAKPTQQRGSADISKEMWNFYFVA